MRDRYSPEGRLCPDPIHQCPIRASGNAPARAPLRDRLQRGVNRLMYGERDDPYGVLSRLGQRLEATLEPHTVLPAVAETVAQALKLPHVAIELKRDDEYETSAEYGRHAGDSLRLPLIYGTETVGRIVLSPRAPGEAFGPADRRLLDDLARQAGSPPMPCASPKICNVRGSTSSPHERRSGGA